MLTILTATYNRAEKLKKLYASLLEQTDYNFEWIIADDGSTDNTDNTVKTFDGSGKFKVIYTLLPHGGKHRAVNAGSKLANGEYIAIMDSDDYFIPDGVEIINKCTKEIANENMLAGIMMTQYKIKDGKTYSNGSFPPNVEYVDLFNFERNNKKYCGDRLEVIKRELMLKYPFPEFEGEYFVTESAVWSKMSADGYKFRIYRQAVCVIEYLEGGLTGNFAKLRLDNYLGYVYAMKITFENLSFFKDFWVIRNYALISKAKGVSVKEAAKAVGASPLLIGLLRLTKI